MFGVSNDVVRLYAQEKGIDEDAAFKIVEQTLKTAYKTTYKTDENAIVTVGDKFISIYSEKTVVEEVADPVREISLAKAKELTPAAELNDKLLIEVDTSTFRRRAAQAGVQRVNQLSKELQKDSLYAEYKPKEGEIIIGYYQRERNGTIYVDLGRVEGLLPKKHQLPQEDYQQNSRIKALVKEVKKHANSNMIQLILSRTEPAFVKELLSVEVPEIYDGIVEIYKIVREPGMRTKVAVISRRDDVDPVGACVGPRGVRIQNIIKELNDEKIDVLEYSPDPAVFIQNALSPAEVLDVVILDEEKRSALAIVAESQLSIAIGKQGLNVRLANRLADWNIDVKTERQFAEMDVYTDSRRAAEELFADDYEDTEQAPLLLEDLDIPQEIMDILHENQIQDIETLINLSENELKHLSGMTDAYATRLCEIIDQNFEIVSDEHAETTESVQEEPADQSDVVSTEDDLYEDEVLVCPECGVAITTDMSECPGCGIGLSFEYEDEE